MVQTAPLKSCPNHHQRLQINFRENKSDRQDPWSIIQVTCDESDVTAKIRTQDHDHEVRLWMNANAPSQSESVCIKLNCIDFVTPPDAAEPSSSYQVACNTRILASNKPNEIDQDSTKTTAESADQRPNILVVNMNTLSRSQFDFIMPRTQTLRTEELDFVSFDKYTTVGDNAGPNQMALYAGKRQEDQDDLPLTSSSQAITWIWDELCKSRGYATFKAQDGCTTKSNGMQPNTTHGASLHDMFCFHFARPNCVGNQLAADYLLNHTRQFIETYEARKKSPWAAFVSLVDAHEDTQTLGAVIDTSVVKFLNWTIAEAEGRRRNTVVIVLSDQGLHYGPYFQSLEGQRERSQPLLYMRIPDTLGGNQLVSRNMNAWVTPFDVHSTLLRFAGIAQNESPHGTSLSKDLSKYRMQCRDAKSIPEHHCVLLEHSNAESALVPPEPPPMPPSLMSFYADIPKDHRYKNNNCIEPRYNVTKTFRKAIRSSKALGSCNCSTSHRDWFPCVKHPWGEEANSTKFPYETFLMLSCPEQPLQMQSRVVRNEKLVTQLEEKRQLLDQEPPPPSILILEVDSVSVEYADRHFKKTRTLLQQYRPETKDKFKKKGHRGLCAVDFSKFGVVGPNSIANQVASTSGCFVTMRHESCLKESSQVGDVCEDPSLFEYGMKLKSIGPREHTVYCHPNETDPFLFDIAKDRGYVTFFGEEFCYPGSPFVMQDNVFPLRADIELHPAFCRYARRLDPLEPTETLYKAANRKRCTDGKYFGESTQSIGLKLLTQMWDAYTDDVPKFAYINSMSAQVYASIAPMQSLNAEEYDEYLFRFLQNVLNRPDADKTIVMVRSDHGLQGGPSAPVDYSTQLEQRHPWTEIIIPESSYPVDMLLENSGKMVTPFDLYKTVRSLMEGGRGGKQAPWSTNLLYEAVPSTRTCKDAKVLPEHCPKGETPFPTFGVCNMFEAGQAVFCRDPTNGGPLQTNNQTNKQKVE